MVGKKREIKGKEKKRKMWKREKREEKGWERKLREKEKKGRETHRNIRSFWLWPCPSPVTPNTWQWLVHSDALCSPSQVTVSRQEEEEDCEAQQQHLGYYYLPHLDLRKLQWHLLESPFPSQVPKELGRKRKKPHWSDTTSGSFLNWPLPGSPCTEIKIFPFIMS